MAGTTRNCFSTWKEITNDPWVLNAVNNFKIPLDNIPEQGLWHPIAFSKHDTILINEEIKNLLFTGVIEECQHSSDKIISNIFTRPKQEHQRCIIRPP
jgi:hypothetical protein